MAVITPSITTHPIELEEGSVYGAPNIAASKGTVPSVWSRTKSTTRMVPEEKASSWQTNCQLCLLFLIFASLASLVGILGGISVKLNEMGKPAQDGWDNVTRFALELEPLIKDVGPVIHDLASASDAVQTSFSKVVRGFGPPESVPQLLTNILMLHVGNVTSALARIGHKLEPKLQSWRYQDEGLAEFAHFWVNFFKAIEYLDGPVHEAEATVLGDRQSAEFWDGGYDIFAMVQSWLGDAPIEYLVKQLDPVAWNHTSKACRSLREELSIVLTRMGVIHPHLDLSSPTYIWGYTDPATGEWVEGYYAMHAPPSPPSPSPSPPAPRVPPFPPVGCEMWCEDSYGWHPQDICGGGMYVSDPYGASQCGGCSFCDTYRTAPLPPPAPGYCGDSCAEELVYNPDACNWRDDCKGCSTCVHYFSPSREDDATDESELEQGLRAFYMALSPFCQILESMSVPAPE